MCLVRKFVLKTYVVLRTPLRVASHSGRFTHKETITVVGVCMCSSLCDKNCMFCLHSAFTFLV